MLAVITNHNAHLYTNELDQMFALRHRVLINDLKWSSLDGTGGREKDQFDNDTAIYLLAFHENWQRVMGCVRMNPSLAPNLTSEVFEYLCDFDGLPRSERLYDSTRFVVDPDTRILGNPNPIATELMLGTFEAAQALGLEGFTGVTDMDGLSRLLSTYGKFLKPLGLPKESDGQNLLAVKAIVSDKAVNAFRDSWGRSEPVLSKTAIGLLLATHQLFHRQFEDDVAA